MNGYLEASPDEYHEQGHEEKHTYQSQLFSDYRKYEVVHRLRKVQVLLYAFPKTQSKESSRAERKKRLYYLEAVSKGVLERIPEARQTVHPVLISEIGKPYNASEHDRYDSDQISPLQPREEKHPECYSRYCKSCRKVRLHYDESAVDTCYYGNRQYASCKAVYSPVILRDEACHEHDDGYFRKFPRHDGKRSDSDPSCRVVYRTSESCDYEYKKNQREYHDRDSQLDQLVVIKFGHYVHADEARTREEDLTPEIIERISFPVQSYIIA